MKVRKIYWGDWHIFRCHICFEMERRGYNAGSMKDESKYWDEFFDHKEKPIKYKLVKARKYEE